MKSINEILSSFKSIPGILFNKPLGVREIENIFLKNNIKTNSAYQKLLTSTNGLYSYGNYFRIFGINNNYDVNLFKWNDYESWRFAWSPVVDNYFCFGENAWGDQYAYQIYEDRSLSKEIYVLDADTMDIMVTYETLEEFLDQEFRENSLHPFDETIYRFRQKFGDIDIQDHLIRSPSPLLYDSEDDNSIQKILSFTSMTIKGDIYTQLNSVKNRKINIIKLESYIDENGRGRVNFLFEN